MKIVRQAKVGETFIIEIEYIFLCLSLVDWMNVIEKFDKDAEVLNSKLKNEIFLPADVMMDLRRKYAYNMFDEMTPKMANQPTDRPTKK